MPDLRERWCMPWTLNTPGNLNQLAYRCIFTDGQVCPSNKKWTNKYKYYWIANNTYYTPREYSWANKASSLAERVPHETYLPGWTYNISPVVICYKLAYSRANSIIADFGSTRREREARREREYWRHSRVGGSLLSGGHWIWVCLQHGQSSGWFDAPYRPTFILLNYLLTDNVMLQE